MSFRGSWQHDMTSTFPAKAETAKRTIDVEDAFDEDPPTIQLKSTAPSLTKNAFEMIVDATAMGIRSPSVHCLIHKTNTSSGLTLRCF